MIVNSTKINNVPFSKFYNNYVQSDIRNIKNKYKYISKTSEESDLLIEKMVKTKYMEIKNSNISRQVDFSSELREMINTYIKEKLEKEDTESLELFNRYIKDNIKIDENYLHMKRQLDRIFDFFTEIDYSPSVDRYMELIRNNSQFNKVLEVVFTKNKNLLKNDDINDFSNNNLMFAIEAYAFLNDIDLDEYDNNTIEKISKDLLEAGYSANDLRFYLNSLNKPILTREKEHELFIRIKNGDNQARNELIESNLRLSVVIAKRYIGMGVEFLDLIQEGNIGIMTAIDKFDPEKGYKFSTYATYWIRQKISRSVMQKGRTIRIPVHMYEKINRYNSVKKELTIKYGKAPTAVEIANELKIPVRKVLDMELIDAPSISISTPIVNDEDSSTLEDIIPSLDKSVEETIEEEFLPDLIKEVFKKVRLNERAIEIIKMRNGFYNDEVMTLNSIGEKFGLSKERISQIEIESYRKILDSNYKQLLLDYLDNPQRTLNNLEKLKERKRASLKRRRKEADNLYTYFSEYDQEDLTDILNNLPHEYIPILHERYGKDLANPVLNMAMPYYRKQNINVTIIPYITKQLEERKRNKLKIVTTPTRDRLHVGYCSLSKEDYIKAREILIANKCNASAGKKLLAPLLSEEEVALIIDKEENSNDKKTEQLRHREKSMTKNNNLDSPKILVK